MNKKMKKCLISVLSVLLVCTVFCVAGPAQVPKKLNYQGYLIDSSGNPVNGTVSMSFAIYNVATGGSPLWTEIQTIQVNDGRYSAFLGSVTPIELTGPRSYYLGIKIGTDPEMMPREELTSTMYALFVDGITLDENIFLGKDAGFNNTEGEANIFIGEKAGYNNTRGTTNTFIGKGAGYNKQHHRSDQYLHRLRSGLLQHHWHR